MHTAQRSLLKWKAEFGLVNQQGGGGGCCWEQLCPALLCAISTASRMLVWGQGMGFALGVPQGEGFGDLSSFRMCTSGVTPCSAPSAGTLALLPSLCGSQGISDPCGRGKQESWLSVLDLSCGSLEVGS